MKVTDQADSAAVREAFERVYASQWLAMVRFATLTTGSVALSEEIVQEAFVDLYRHWDRVQNPVAYLRTAVAHRATSWVRHRQLERRFVTSVDIPPDDEPVVELLDAMKGLTDRQRAAIVMRYLYDLPEADIAAALSCRPGTVKSLLARGLTRLEEVLQP